MNLEHIFTHHSLNPIQQAKCSLIRDAALEFSRVLVANTPESADQSAAIRKVREAVMTANVSVALSDDPYKEDTLLPWNQIVCIRIPGIKDAGRRKDIFDCMKALDGEGYTIDTAIDRLKAIGVDAEALKTGY